MRNKKVVGEVYKLNCVVGRLIWKPQKESIIGGSRPHRRLTTVQTKGYEGLHQSQGYGNGKEEWVQKQLWVQSGSVSQHLVVFRQSGWKSIFPKFSALRTRRWVIPLRRTGDQTRDHKRIQCSVFDIWNFPCDVQCPIYNWKCSTWEIDQG